MNSASSLKVGYVLKVFPRLSETFILNEILELERQGVEVEIFSLKPPTEPRFHGQLAQLQAPVTYLTRVDSGSSWQDVESLAADLNRDATAVGTAFLKSLQEDGRDCLKLFPQALQLAALVRRLGIGHLHAHFASVATRIEIEADVEQIHLGRSEITVIPVKVAVNSGTEFKNFGLIELDKYTEDSKVGRFIRRDDDEQQPDPIRVGPAYIGGKRGFGFEATRNLDLDADEPDSDDWYRARGQVEIAAPLGEYSEVPPGCG